MSSAVLGPIKANLFWAFAYDITVLPPAVAGLLDPLIAGGAMGLSWVFVVNNQPAGAPVPGRLHDSIQRTVSASWNAATARTGRRQRDR